jgi:23S rRNA (adenine2503-C2)-methyltransferase
VSTQVGCRFKCVFCRSGREGLVRNLSAGEIAGQLLAVERQLGEDRRIGKLVLMGIGEPLDNYEETCRALRVWLDRRERVLTGGRIVVSTVGIPEAVGRLSRDLGGRVSLALSLHSPSAEKRSRIVQGAGREPPAALVKAASRFDFPPRERLTIEYVLTRGLNDSEADARELARLLRGVDCMVNLIPLNEVRGLRFKPSTREQSEAFQEALRRAGVRAFIRRRRGGGVQAACGQLAFDRE